MAAEMSPVETLRAAAAKLRALAKEATPGPWERNWAFSTHFVVPKVAGNVAADNVSRLKRNQRGDAEWIALVHPGVAEPLADWLDSAAGQYEYGPPRRRDPHALAVARVLLGVPDGE